MLARMLLVAACCVLVGWAPAPVVSPHPGWEPLASSSRTPMEIDRRRIVRDRGFVEIWLRTRAEPDSVAAEFEAAGAAPERVARVRDALGHSEHLWSFHCETGTHALGHSAYYDVEGRLIQAFNVERRAYWPVQTDTIGERIRDVACGAPTLRAGTDADVADIDVDTDPPDPAR